MLSINDNLWNMSMEDINQEVTDENVSLEELQESPEDQKKGNSFFGKKEKTKELKEQIKEKEIEIQEAKDKYIRLYAEFDNYKKRTSKERFELIATAGRDTIAALLPVLDDFDRAKRSADDENSPESFSEGVLLVYNKLHNIMKSKGLTAMESTGQLFDPELHEALTEIPAPTEDLKGKNIDTVETGYLLHDKIIRHAKVVVGK